MRLCNFPTKPEVKQYEKRYKKWRILATQQANTGSKLVTETLEARVKYTES